MKRRYRMATVAFALLLPAAFAAAQASGMALSFSLVSDATLASSAGSMALNLSAGSGNAQANMVVIGVGNASSVAAIDSRQQVNAIEQGTRGLEMAEIGARSFHDASGIVALNQSSGIANTQANLVAIAVGNVSEVAIDQLGSTNVAPDSSDATIYRIRRSSSAFIADSAFAAAHGIVQVNQLAGFGNSTANIFALSVSVGAQ
jgi:hypothetical protein